MTPQIHELKLLPAFYADSADGRKNSEFRLNDRNFQAGDLVLLREFIPPPKGLTEEATLRVVHGFTGREHTRRITHVLDHAAFNPVPEGWVVLSLADVVPAADEDTSVVRGEFITKDGFIPPEKVIGEALKADLREVVVVGYIGKDTSEGPGELYVASTSPDPMTVLMLQQGLYDASRRISGR